MPLPRLVGGKLHRCGEKTILVIGDMAFQEGNNMARGRHRPINGILCQRLGACVILAIQI